MSQIRELSAAFAVVVVLIGGCATEAADEPTASGSSPTLGSDASEARVSQDPEVAAPEEADAALDEVGGSPATEPVDRIDFDALYRRLDGIRVEALEQEDPELLASVSANKQEITDLGVEADDVDTAWDRSATTYEIHLVELFDVIDEVSVLLYVEDSTTGAAVKRDLAGQVLEEGRSREVPRLGFVVWMERTSGEGWKIVRDYAVPVGFPRHITAFEPAISETVEGATITLRTAMVSDGFCYLIEFPDMAPYPGCQIFAEEGSSARGLIRVDRSGRYEAVLLAAPGPGFDYNLAIANKIADTSPVVKSTATTGPINIPVGPRYIWFAAALRGTYAAFQFDDPDLVGGFGYSSGDFWHTSLLAKRYWEGTEEDLFGS